MIHLDTSFVIDLLRESERAAPGPATRLLESIAADDLWISVHVACELFAGAELSRRPSQERQKVERLCDGLHIAFPDGRFAPAYGRLLGMQERTGQRVATMDLLIATAAILDQAPLVTRNVKDFSRIGGLELREY